MCTAASGKGCFVVRIKLKPTVVTANSCGMTIVGCGSQPAVDAQGALGIERG